MDLNKVMIIGRLTRDPEIRTTAQGINVASFGLATNLIWTNSQGERQEKVEFHNIVAWRKLGEICGQYLKKGKKIYLEGRLQTQSWEDPNGVKKQRTEIVAENMIMLDGGKSSASTSNQITTEETPSTEETKDNESKEEEEINIEEIPF